METFTKDKLKTFYLMEQEKCFLMMEVFTKETGAMGTSTEKEHLDGLMVKLTLESM